MAKNIARLVPGATLTVLAFALASAGAYLNYLGAGHMVPGAASVVVSWAAVGAEFIKLFWLVGLTIALAARQWGAAIGVTILGIALHAFSLTCAVGVASFERSIVLDDRGSLQQRKARAEAREADAQAQVKALRGKRPAGEVQAALTEADAEVSRQATREAAERTSTCLARCQDAITKGDAAKAKAALLREELKLSIQAEDAQKELQAARADLGDIKAPTSVDPQADALAAFLPVSKEWLSKGLPLLPSLIVEFVPTLTLMMAGLFFGTATISAPRPQVSHIETAPPAIIEPVREDEPETQITLEGAKRAVLSIAQAIEDAGGTIYGQTEAGKRAGFPRSTTSEIIRKVIKEDPEFLPFSLTKEGKLLVLRTQRKLADIDLAASEWQRQPA